MIIKHPSGVQQELTPDDLDTLIQRDLDEIKRLQDRIDKYNRDKKDIEPQQKVKG